MFNSETQTRTEKQAWSHIVVIVLMLAGAFGWYIAEWLFGF